MSMLPMSSPRSREFRPLKSVKRLGIILFRCLAWERHNERRIEDRCQPEMSCLIRSVRIPVRTYRERYSPSLDILWADAASPFLKSRIFSATGSLHMDVSDGSYRGNRSSAMTGFARVCALEKQSQGLSACWTSEHDCTDQ